MTPYLPITPDQIADNAIQASEAGAAVCHIHARNPGNGMPSPDIEIFKKIITKIKSKCDMVVCTTTGGGLGMTPEQRVFEFRREDLVRVWREFPSGPEGIFLKRGSDPDLRIGGAAPFVHVDVKPDADTSRLYFAQSFIYPLFAAPFIRHKLVKF